MAVGRRELMLGTLGMGLALAAGFRPVRAQRNIAQPFSTYGVVPRAGNQTAALQDAADQAAESGTPFFLPPGNYMSGKLELKSGTQIQGVPGKSVLCYTGGGALISIENASDIRLTGLTLEGEAKPIDSGALLIAESVKGLTLSDCRVIGSAEHGIVLHEVSGRITDCEIGLIGESSGLFSQDAAGLQSRIIMCTTVALTASWCAARRRARTPPWSSRIASSASWPRAAAAERTATPSTCFMRGPY